MIIAVGGFKQFEPYHKIRVLLREDINRKKTFSFGRCPNHLNPPTDPGQLGPFFLDVKIQDLKVTGEHKKKICKNVGRGGKYINNLKNS